MALHICRLTGLIPQVMGARCRLMASQADCLSFGMLCAIRETDEEQGSGSDTADDLGP